MNESVRVLVVEDSDDQLVLLRRHLERAGVAVATATTAEDAVRAYKTDRFQLAVVDLVLPGMDGWELIRRMRRDVPGIAIAVTSVLDRAEFPEADALLPKPFTSAQVRQVLRDTVGWRPR